VVIVPDGVDAGPPIQVLFCNTEQPLQAANTTTDTSNNSAIADDSSANDGSTTTTDTATNTTPATIDHRQSSVDPLLVAQATYPRLIVLQGNHSHLHLKQSYHTILEKKEIDSAVSGDHNTADSDGTSTTNTNTMPTTQTTNTSHTTHPTHHTHTTNNPTYASTLFTRPNKARKMLLNPTTEMYKTTIFNAHARAKVEYVLQALSAVNGKSSGSSDCDGSSSSSSGSNGSNDIYAKATTTPPLPPVGAMSPGLVVARSTLEMGRGAIMYHTYVQDLSSK